MKILLIILAVLAGKYVDLPAWQIIVALTATVWVLHRINKDWEEDEQERTWESDTIDQQLTYKKEVRQEMKRQYITAREISEIMGTSQGQAYKFIRQMNQELKEQGFLIVAGKVPIAYFKTKCFGVEFEEGEAWQQDTAGTGAAV